MGNTVKRKMIWYRGLALVILLLVSILAISCQGPAGTQGPAGPQGPPGPAGPAGPSGATPTPTPPPAAVVVNAGADQTAKPGATVTLKAAAKINNSSTISGYKWTQTAGVAATITGAGTDTVQVTLNNAAAYKTALINGLETLDRFSVQAINPHALSAAEIATFNVAVTTSTGTYNDTINVNADLPYVVNTGLANVPQGEPVLVQSKKQASYTWSVTGPATSKASLTDSATQNPSFTPDVIGKYALTEKSSNTTLNVYVGTWAGAISGQDSKGRPLSGTCTVCHDGKTASNNFTDWAKSGHAEIFTQNINDPAGHWSLSCAPCHTVGYDSNVQNGGFDAAVASANWTAPAHGDKGLWDQILAKYPDMAKNANIQCENCHGPNNSVLHANGAIDAARVSLSSDVCGACHGEPARHGRFQQWEESGHANFELAIDDATVEARAATAAHCGRCHSAQGFLKWIQQPDLTQYIQGKNGNATVAELTTLGLTKDQILPQTCVVCHDPHAQGTLSGEPNTATVRILDDTAQLPAGFKATEVGKGALCMTCHNTRNLLHNQNNPPTSYSGPHEAAQADVLMGENAYFISISERSPHSYITDTCVTCHMEKTPPPAEFSYNLAGTNHSFKASLEICKDCHAKELNGAALQAGVTSKLETLGTSMAKYLQGKLPTTFYIKDYTLHESGGKSYDVASSNTSISKDNIASIAARETPLHGQEAFVIKFKSPVSFTYAPAGEAPHTLNLSQAEVQLSGVYLTDAKTVVVSATDTLVKAGWNYFLIKNDKSLGVHNPAFAHEALDAAIEALK